MASKWIDPVPWIVPTPRVFPWWYLFGGVVAAFSPLLIYPEGSAVVSGVFVFFPAGYVTVNLRQRRAGERRADGLGLSRRELVGPWWIEPVVTAVLVAFCIGLTTTTGWITGTASSWTHWPGLALLAIGGSALAVVIRRIT